MNIDVILLPAPMQSAQLAGRSVVAVDVLRATSTMIVALARGVAHIHPVETLEDARKLAQLHSDALLAGEVNSLRPEDFHYDNSPLELHLAPGLEGRRLIMRSTNGTRLLQALREAGVKDVLIGSFLNLDALVTMLCQRKQDVVICCSGDGGQLSLEDAGLAGALVSRLKALVNAPVLTDAAMMAVHLWQGVDEEIDTLFGQSAHATQLIHLGRIGDLDFVAQTTLPVVPVFEGQSGLITLPPDSPFVFPHVEARQVLNP